MRDVIERLTGHASEVNESFIDTINDDAFWQRHRIGVSQLNEILLSLAYETVSDAFYDWVFGERRRKVQGVDRTLFERQIEAFQKVALLKYGNVKFAFKRLCKMQSEELNRELQSLEPTDIRLFTDRPVPLMSIVPIDPAETYMLGHITGETVENSGDVRRKNRLAELREIGLDNLKAYLCSDEMDVYVATSMRDVEDFYFVGSVTKRLFAKPQLSKLKLRYFDPTQSFCTDRIEKGLVESLMLRRARCTVYCAQTTETLGKDSELAVTLAQAKPVIVYVPKIKGNKKRYKSLCREAAQIHSGINSCSIKDYYIAKLIERHARRLPSGKAELKTLKLDQLEQRLIELDDFQFEVKAKTLKDRHPLGIQVDLRTGVANGVLVVRTLTQCAEMVKAVLLNTMRFRLERDSNESLRLVEERTGCTYRLTVSNPVLSNSFWNFYKPTLETTAPSP